MPETIEKRPSLFSRMTSVAIGSALVAGGILEESLAAALTANRRMWDTVERVAEPLTAPLDALGVTDLVRGPMTAMTTRIEIVVDNLEIMGRSGLILGENAASYTITGIIDSVLAYLRENQQVNDLIDAQLTRLLPVLAAHPAVQDLVRQQVQAILPQLGEDPAVQEVVRQQVLAILPWLGNEPAIQELVRRQVQAILPELSDDGAVKLLISTQAGHYIQYLHEHPDQVQLLIRNQGDAYISYLNANPGSVQNLVQGQSLTLASQMRDEVRERTVTGDSVVDTIVRNILRLKPREDLAPPDPEIRRRAETGKLTSDFVRGRPNGDA